MRQYKLLEITTQYEQYLRQFYNTHQDIEGLSYNDLFSMIADDAFGESDFIHRQLRKMGIDSKVIFCNNRNLQNKWCSRQESKSLFDILLLQIKEFKPDVILISDMCYFSLEDTMRIKDCFFGKKIKLVGFHFATLNDRFKKNAVLYDQIYTGNKVYLSFMRDSGLPAYLLRHAFEPSILDKIPRYERKNELCFLGSIFTGDNMHNNRLDMFNEIIRSGLPYTFWGNIYGTIQEILSSADGKKYISIIAEIAKNIRREVFGTEYWTTMGKYKICLNLHVSRDDHGVGNMRMFEATGMGTCLLTDHKNGNEELFDTTNEIVVYDSFEDMVQKAKWLIDNPKKATEIASAGQKRTLTDYTYRRKAECLNEYIQMLLV